MFKNKKKTTFPVSSLFFQVFSRSPAALLWPLQDPQPGLHAGCQHPWLTRGSLNRI